MRVKLMSLSNQILGTDSFVFFWAAVATNYRNKATIWILISCCSLQSLTRQLLKLSPSEGLLSPSLSPSLSVSLCLSLSLSLPLSLSLSLTPVLPLSLTLCFSRTLCISLSLSESPSLSNCTLSFSLSYTLSFIVVNFGVGCLLGSL